MFELSDAKRRLVCRLVFLLACVLPTVATAYFLVHPFSKMDWERLIKAEVGLPLHCEAIETPYPACVVLRNVTFEGAAYAGVEVIPEIQISFKDIVHVKVPFNVTFDTTALSELKDCIQSGMLAHVNPDRNWLVTVDKAVINNGRNRAQSLILSPIEFSLSPKDNGRSVARTKFRTQPDDTLPPVEIVIERQHVNEETCLQHLYINTGDWLPNWLATSCVPKLENLGANSKFALKLDLERSGSGWIGHAYAEATGVELAAWTQNLAAQMTGMATLNFDCDIANNKVNNLTATMAARNGSFDPRWMSLFGLQSKDPVSSIDYGLLQAKLNISNDKLTLSDVNLVNQDGTNSWQSPGMTVAIQDAVHNITSVGIAMEIKNEDRPIDVRLNNQGVDILRHFELSPPKRTANNPQSLLQR